MNISIILAHPNRESLNHAIAERAQKCLIEQGHEVAMHDLYAEGFDAILPAGEIPRDGEVAEQILKQCAETQQADGIIVVHPNWWGMPPAILKGWVDRVIRPGVAYEFLEGDGGEGVPNGLLNAKFALVFNTGNTEAVREQETFGDPLQLIWERCIFGLCGVTDFTRRLFGIVVVSTEEERGQWLDDVESLVLSKVKQYETGEPA